MYASIEELVSDATSKNLPISELVIQAECNDMNVSRNDVWRKMKHNLDTMRLAVVGVPMELEYTLKQD